MLRNSRRSGAVGTASVVSLPDSSFEICLSDPSEQKASGSRYFTAVEKAATPFESDTVRRQESPLDDTAASPVTARQCSRVTIANPHKEVKKMPPSLGRKDNNRCTKKSSSSAKGSAGAKERPRRERKAPAKFGAEVGQDPIKLLTNRRNSGPIGAKLQPRSKQGKLGNRRKSAVSLTNLGEALAPTKQAVTTSKLTSQAREKKRKLVGEVTGVALPPSEGSTRSASRGNSDGGPLTKRPRTTRPREILGLKNGNVGAELQASLKRTTRSGHGAHERTQNTQALPVRPPRKAKEVALPITRKSSRRKRTKIIRSAPSKTKPKAPRRQIKRYLAQKDDKMASGQRDNAGPVPSTVGLRHAEDDVAEVSLRGNNEEDIAGETTADQSKADAPTDSQTAQDGNWWDPLDASKVAVVRGALHVSTAAVPGNLPLCRDRQISAVDRWLADRLVSAQGGSMYISGLPGTGKSLTAMELVRRCGRHVTREARCSLPPALLTVNCMRLVEPRHVVDRILVGYEMACRSNPFIDNSEHNPVVQVPVSDDAGQLREAQQKIRRASTSSGGSAEDSLAVLRRIALQPMPLEGYDVGITKGAAQRRKSSIGGTNDRGMIVVVLDEMDGLLSGRSKDELLGELFALAHAPRSRLVLIGIANSIDLVEQLLRAGGSLHLHNIRPAHEIFPAYLRTEISHLIHQRLAALPSQVFEPIAIEFCARKIANGNGDMRRALEASIKAVDVLVDQEREEHTRKQNEPVPGVTETRPSQLVGMRHMSVALGSVTGGIGAGNQNVVAISTLPVPQQLLMCTIAKLVGDTLASRGLSVTLPASADVALRGQTNAARFIGGGGGPPANPLDLGNGSRSAAALRDAQRRRSGVPAGGDKQRRKELTLGNLRAAFAGLCKRVGVAEYTIGEFGTAVDLLCTLGLIEVRGGTNQGTHQRVVLQVPEDDVLLALADVPVLKNVVGA